jgi:hypothetical protein
MDEEKNRARNLAVVLTVGLSSIILLLFLALSCFSEVDPRPQPESPLTTPGEPSSIETWPVATLTEKNVLEIMPPIPPPTGTMREAGGHAFFDSAITGQSYPLHVSWFYVDGESDVTGSVQPMAVRGIITSVEYHLDEQLRQGMFVYTRTTQLKVARASLTAPITSNLVSTSKSWFGIPAGTYREEARLRIVLRGLDIETSPDGVNWEELEGGQLFGIVVQDDVLLATDDDHFTYLGDVNVVELLYLPYILRHVRIK